MIALCGVSAVFLSQCERKSLQRWACIAGLLGQPAWIYATVKAGQAGMIFVCVLYTFAWGKGFWTHWIKPRVSVVPVSEVKKK